MTVGLEEAVARGTYMTVAGVLVAGTVLSSALAWAAVPGSDGVITGCRDNRTGTLRVIDAENGEQCRPKESLLTWNQNGPQGPAGPTGEPGLSGYEVVVTSVECTNCPREVLATVTCPSGKKVLGGGGTSRAGAGSSFAIRASWPTDKAASDPMPPESWNVIWTSSVSGNALLVQVYAICATTAG